MATNLGEVKMAEKGKTVAVEDGLRDYELILVFSPEVGEEALNAAVNKVTQFITDKGGTLSTAEQWGKRRLAYPIKRFMEGSYVLTRFRLEPTATKELEANLRISEEIIRHLLVKLSE